MQITLQGARLPVIVFGASGFIGRYLAKHLEESHIVYRFSRKDGHTFETSFISEYVRSQIGNKKPFHVFYAIGPAPIKSIDDLRDSYKLVDSVTLALKDFDNLRTFTYFSSDAVYGSEGELITEASFTKPESLHGFSHLLNELLLTNRLDKDKLTIIRPVAIFGIGDTHNSYGPNRMIREAYSKGEIRLFNEGKDLRDHIWIEDAVITAIKLSSQAKGIVNLVSGKIYSFRDIASMIMATVPFAVSLKIESAGDRITVKSFDDSLLKTITGDSLHDSITRGIVETIEQGGFDVESP
jgi:nucleoside-diphosphate-sugar epimerase